MKEIKAIIKPFMLGKVQEALHGVPGFPGMTVTECRGIGSDRLQRQPKERSAGPEFVTKVRIEIVTTDELAEELAEVIVKAAHTGNPGDGLVYLSPVDSAIRVRTFEKNE